MINLNWWQRLIPEWKSAFAETFFKHPNEPTDDELAQLFLCPVLRLVGPRAPYPNMTFELTNLSGVTALINLEILIVAYHQVTKIAEVCNLHKLKSLFINNNNISTLTGIEELIMLEQLYVQHNAVSSIKEVGALVNLKELYIHDNNISSLIGLTDAHTEKLETFYCKPNSQLKQREMLRVENQLFIRCRALP